MTKRWYFWYNGWDSVDTSQIKDRLRSCNIRYAIMGKQADPNHYMSWCGYVHFFDRHRQRYVETLFPGACVSRCYDHVADAIDYHNELDELYEVGLKPPEVNPIPIAPFRSVARNRSGYYEDGKPDKVKVNETPTGYEGDDDVTFGPNDCDHENKDDDVMSDASTLVPGFSSILKSRQSCGFQSPVPRNPWCDSSDESNSSVDDVTKLGDVMLSDSFNHTKN